MSSSQKIKKPYIKEGEKFQMTVELESGVTYTFDGYLTDFEMSVTSDNIAYASSAGWMNHIPLFKQFSVDMTIHTVGTPTRVQR